MFLDHFISPDALRTEERSYTFIYADEIGLIFGKGISTHAELLDREIVKTEDWLLDDPHNSEALEYYDWLEEFRDMSRGRRACDARAEIRSAEATALIGRCGKTFIHPMEFGSRNKKMGYVVAFWNEDQETYDEFLDGCINELIAHDLISYSYYISTPIEGQTDPRDRPQNKPLSPQDTETLEKAGRSPNMDELKKLHLLRGNEKKQALKRLGLGLGGGKHEWQQALEKAGLSGPGQKWWAPHSESLFDHKLGIILDHVQRT